MSVPLKKDHQFISPSFLDGHDHLQLVKELAFKDRWSKRVAEGELGIGSELRHSFPTEGTKRNEG